MNQDEQSKLSQMDNDLFGLSLSSYFASVVPKVTPFSTWSIRPQYMRWSKM